jgi:hypothetical protein
MELYQTGTVRSLYTQTTQLAGSKSRRITWQF